MDRRWSHINLNITNLKKVKLFKDRIRVKKYDRICSMQLYYQNGRVYYNIKLKNHNDTQVGLYQLKGIEPRYKGKDDAPDSDQYGFFYLDNFRAHEQETTVRRRVTRKRRYKHY